MAMAVEESTAPARFSPSSPPTVGTLLTRASAAGPPRGRDCSSPRSLLSRILHRGRRGGGGFGCRLRLFPRYCSSVAAAKEDAHATANEEHLRETAAPKVVGDQLALRESPRSSLAGKKATAAEDALPASLGLGASLVLLLSKSAAELSRMAELRAQMERLMLDVRADVRSCNGRPSGSEGHTDGASVVKGPFVRAGDDEGAVPQSAPASRGTSENAGHRDMDRMEAELEAELSRLQQASSDEEHASPWRDRELETEAKSSASSRSHSAICSGSDDDGVDDDGATDSDSDGNQDNDNEEEDELDAESNGKSPPHGGVSARELERRLHALLQSRHEARIAELESALERARRKLRETEREASRWRDTAKLATRFTDESRLR
ncbi:hypothetical protein SEVIR_1G357100v4 [Setaria viridis]|uniref:Protein POLAR LOCALIZATION DURING ASYMMETRIC DIVISION AND REDISTRIBUTION n=1 Tax=Setaria viridis TaxID=4556 RepID=A0A4U6WKH5_SETVI|nr:protein POLAR LOCALIZATION DURING ASYMMETRIC DIVISION AND REDISTRIBUTION-like [Setaria viridis]TKW42029.1 hypothetical protein SEVIR_1G357100v2 [Setaria viridis]